MKQKLDGSNHIRRIWSWRYLLLLSITPCLLCSCATMWYQVDPQYKALQSKVKTNWNANDIVGIWVAQTSARPGLPAMRVTIVIKPDHTAQQIANGISGGSGTWTYNNRGTWTIIPNNDGDDMDASLGMHRLSIALQYTGRYLLADAPWSAGVYSAGGVVKNKHVFVRPEDKEAVREIKKKRF